MSETSGGNQTNATKISLPRISLPSTPSPTTTPSSRSLLLLLILLVLLLLLLLLILLLLPYPRSVNMSHAAPNVVITDPPAPVYNGLSLARMVSAAIEDPDLPK